MEQPFEGWGSVRRCLRPTLMVGGVPAVLEFSRVSPRTPMSCLDQHTALALSEGRLPEAESRAAAAHLADCVACATLLQRHSTQGHAAEPTGPLGSAAQPTLHTPPRRDGNGDDGGPLLIAGHWT